MDQLADGTPLTSDMTNQQLLDAVNAACPGTLTTDADGNQVLKLDGVKDFKLTTGASGTAGFTTTFEASTKVPKTNTAGNSLFYTDGTGTYLEEPPDLVYTVTTNDGKTGTLTLPSGSTMKQVLDSLKNPGGTGWTWTEKDTGGNDVAAAPPSAAASTPCGPGARSARWTSATCAGRKTLSTVNWPPLWTCRRRRYCPTSAAPAPSGRNDTADPLFHMEKPHLPDAGGASSMRLCVFYRIWPLPRMMYL